MKVAFVQDWFNANGGAEKVAGAIIDLYKDEDLDIYALFDRFSPEARAEILQNRPVKTSILQYVPGIYRYYRYFLPVMPWLMSRFRLNGYDVILSTSHAVAKGFRTDGKTIHICYCHTPLRPIWDMYQDYAQTHKWGGAWFYRTFVRLLRAWDVATAKRVDYFLANSEHIRQRILKSYGRDATVIYPPVRVDRFPLFREEREDFYLCVGRVVPYKRMDLVMKAFRKMPGKKLVVIGEGWGARDFPELLEQAGNIEWLGYCDDATMTDYIGRAKACIFAAKEDFGIMCVEVQACGTPVLALNYGGYRETVLDGVSGYFFEEQTEDSICGAVQYLEAHPLTDHDLIRQHALRFADRRFREAYTAFVRNALNDKNETSAGPC